MQGQGNDRLWTQGWPLYIYPIASCAFYLILFSTLLPLSSFQVEEDISILEAFDETIKTCFLNGRPLHLSDPPHSAFFILTEAEFKKKSVKEIQTIFRKKHILVTDMTTERLKIDIEGLSSVSALSAVTDIQGMLSLFCILFSWLIQ